MKLLLTSAGIKNASINDAMLDLLGKPIAECDALCIPTASYGHAPRGIRGAYRFITGQATTPDVRAGLEVAGSARAHRAAQPRARALGPRGRGDRRPARERRRLLVPGPPHAAIGPGRPPALARRRLGRLERREHGDDASDRRGLRHLEAARPAATRRWESSTSRSSRTWITPLCRRTPWPPQNGGRPGSAIPAYAIDDDTAIRVVDGTVDVVSEGHWKLFAT